MIMWGMRSHCCSNSQYNAALTYNTESEIIAIETKHSFFGGFNETAHPLGASTSKNLVLSGIFFFAFSP